MASPVSSSSTSSSDGYDVEVDLTRSVSAQILHAGAVQGLASGVMACAASACAATVLCASLSPQATFACARDMQIGNPQELELSSSTEYALDAQSGNPQEEDAALITKSEDADEKHECSQLVELVHSCLESRGARPCPLDDIRFDEALRPTEKEDFHASRPEERTPDIIYAYTTVPNYRSKRCRGRKQVVELCKGARVETFLRNVKCACSHARPALKTANSLRKSKGVSFKDGAEGPESLATYHYVDRAFCGISLFQPASPGHKHCESPHFGDDFARELNALSEESKQKQLKSASLENAVQLGTLGFHCGCCGMSCHPGSSKAEQGVCCGQALYDGLLQEFLPGIYKIVKTALLGDNACIKESTTKGALHVGTLVRVVEVAHDEAAKRIRGRVEGPTPGWISLQNTSNEVPWVIPKKEEFVKEEMELEDALRNAGVDAYTLRGED